MTEEGSRDEQWRAEFDAAVTFTNGGGLQAQGFRLDISGDQISDQELADLFVRHLGLLMVGSVSITNKRLLREPHKGSRGVPSGADARAPRLVELSHPIRDGMVTYPGLPGPEIGEYLSRAASRERYSAGTEFSIGRITMVGNTGTYVDSPFHRFEAGADLASIPLSRLAGLDGIVVRLGGSRQRSIDRAALLAHEVRGRAVLLHTGWASNWGSEAYLSGHPYLTAEGAAWLVDEGAALVGIDSLNIDDTADGSRPVHTALLRAGIPIVEHLRGLDQLPTSGFRFHAAPPALAGMGTFPVRAYAVVEQLSR